VEQIHIAVNRLRAGMIGKGDAVNIDAAMDASGLPLLGVIPEDKDVIACGNQGQVLVLFSTGYARVAYANIARRLRGKRYGESRKTNKTTYKFSYGHSILLKSLVYS
jgi:septum site-determining protein MinD